MKADKFTEGWRAAARARDLEIELPFEGGPMFFRRVPRGEFVMGSRGYDLDEEPMHRVEILHDLYFGTFPVTQRQFDAFCRSKGESHMHHNSAHPLRPAENLDWFQAMEFCVWLTASTPLPVGWSASLPMEVEWEYACRAGTTTEYSSGDGEAALREVGWFGGNSGGGTHPVGELATNGFGLYDMHGNVWEWCLDRCPDEYRERTPVAFHDMHTARQTVNLEDRQRDCEFRGGSFVITARGCRSSFRGRWGPVGRSGRLGFRVCLFPGPLILIGERLSEGQHRQHLPRISRP